MKRKCCLCIIVLSLVSNVTGTDAKSQLSGVERLLGYGFVESVAVTSTGMIIQTSPDENLTKWWGLEPNMEICPALDKDTVFAEHHGAVILSPASFKNKLKGFKVTSSFHSPDKGRMIDIAYIALSDTPVEVGKGDVEMVLDKGEWVTAEEDSRRLAKQLEQNLILQKYGRREAQIILLFEETMRNPKMMAEIAENPELTEAWNNLVKEGIIKTNAVKKAGATSFSLQRKWLEEQDGTVGADGQNEEQHKTNSLWLHICIPFGFLCAILYFMRRKLKT